MRHPFLRSTGSEPKDPDFKNVTVLLHGDGTNGGQNNTFIDSSSNNFAITRNGNVSQGTFSPYGNRWSNYFDGSGDYLSVARSTSFLPVANENFTIEAFVYLTATPGAQTSIIAGLGELGTDADWFFWINSSLQVAFYINTLGTSFTNTTTPLTLNTWTHVAVSRSGTGSNNLKVFVNGVGQSFTSNSTTVGTGNRALTIGSDQNGDEGLLTGYISNLRIIKGTAVYTGNFTPATEPLVAIANTSLLTCQSNRIRDASSNGFSITTNGNTAVSRFSPFAPTVSYHPPIIGGSAYYDGIDGGNYLTVPSGQSPLIMGASDFSFEAWVYPIGSAMTVTTIFSGDPSYYFKISPNSSVISAVMQGATARSIDSPAPYPRQWAHVVWARTGNTLSSYLNGIRVGTTSTLGSDPINDASTDFPHYIGNDSALYSELLGYISGVRIIKGLGGYDATSAIIAVPDAPPTATANTSLLLNFTNAGIINHAMMSSVETVGNSQVSTSVKKYGTGSIYFDGTGDYLSAPVPSPMNQGHTFGTGDFTVEYWIYPVSNTSGAIVDLRSSPSGPGASSYSDYLDSTGKFALFFGASTYLSTSVIPTGEWTHVAVSRSGSNLRVFLNGTQNGATVNNSQSLAGGTLLIGNNRNMNAPFYGYLDDLRITKGVARYTSNFTPPTAPFPNL